MSEDSAPKKKGKLPIILVLLLVLGAGGFFGMKMKSGPKKVEIKAGEVEALDKEFLVNLGSSGTNYLRAEIALQLREGFTKEALDAQMPVIRDCINQILRSKSLQEVGADQTDGLRKQIASGVNAILIRAMKDPEKKQQADFEKEAKEEAALKSDKKSDGPDTSSDWPTPAGPVLDVYFTSFTTQ